jgi:predicted dehydrogenase
MQPLRVGIVGCGNISGIYLKNLTGFRSTEIIAVSDIDLERAKKAAEAYSVPDALTTEQLLASPDVELVLNLTIPKAHAGVNLQAVQAGKHVYCEKPIAIQPEEAQQLLHAAAHMGVKVGCAPDTFLGAGIQTCRKLIDDGAIGKPLAAQAFMLCRGHETWHPSPEFYYQAGGGPMLDMGPYYVTALINLLGGVRRLTGSVRASFETRTITSQPNFGKVVRVETPTHIAGEIDFAQGAIGHITKGTLLVPDPNGVGGEVRLLKPGEGDSKLLPLTHRFAGNWRGLGVLDMAYSIRNGGSVRASGELALHALEIMTGFERSSSEERHLHLDPLPERPAAMDPEEYADEARAV